ncbi:hypothetical protein HHI36_012614 [Cryptolaemus montrouzieri]|uniref:PPIase cyclophilin-type domain-containing protein n=1 Tax=Cryptolaemus montrouzieri TaxID=559131 RepID=A0ABD2NEQ7_9CUCU
MGMGIPFNKLADQFKAFSENKFNIPDESSLRKQDIDTSYTVVYVKMHRENKKCACLECRCTKFVPTTIPRMCISPKNKMVRENDLKIYNEHLERCFYAKAYVDSSPPSFNIHQRLRPMKMIENSFQGEVDTVNAGINFHASSLRAFQFKLLEIEKENKKIYDRIISQTSTYAYDPMEWRRRKKILQDTARYPIVLFKKRNIDREVSKQPSISLGLSKQPLHVECFMDFKVEKGEYLGRIIMELYQDFAPITVQNFVEICKGSNKLSYKNCPVHYIVKNQYLETGDITKGTGSGGFSIFGKSFDEENHKLKHSKPGTLSMVRLKNQKNNSKFCITFRPIEKLDKQNVVFGKVIMGIDVLMKINGYGREIGKPLVKVIISDCGELPPCVCYKKSLRCK